jgi:glycosyltransferase involved in cell wall biosynthesis
VVLDLHEAMPEIFAARFPASAVGYRLALAAEKASCLVAHRVIVVNETIRDLLAGRGVPAHRLLVVYNSPDAAPEPGGPQAILPVSTEGRLRLVYAGTVDPERDLATLIRAVATLRQVRPTVLLLYGPGPAEYRAYLEGLVDGLGLREAVHFGGTLVPDRVLAHLANADVGVVTYARNPITEVALPNKVFEYVLLDKPLVLPDLRAMRHAFDGAAFFYEPGNPDGLAAKIRSAASGGLDIIAMRERARAVYEAAKWDVQAQRLVSVYSAMEAT